MSKFKVGDKVIVISDDHHEFEKGKVFKIHYIDAQGELFDKHGTCIMAKRVELAESKPTKNQRITALENEVAELKVIVHQLRKPSTEVQEALAINFEADADVIEFEGKQYKKVDREARNGDVVVFKKNETDEGYSTTYKPYRVVGMDSLGSIFKGDNGTQFNVYAEAHNRTPETVDVYELIAEDNPFPPSIIPESVKSPNQLRAEVIEKAKGFVEDVKNRNGRYEVKDPHGWSPYSCIVEFIVNGEKRTIVALMRGFESNKIYARGIAKCMPGDVFNEHIGRAIALGRALGLDVSEFEQAVQPTELVIGMKVELLKQLTYPNNRAGAIKLICDKGFYTEGGPKCAIDSNVAKNSRIINDTNAIYSEVSE